MGLKFILCFIYLHIIGVSCYSTLEYYTCLSDEGCANLFRNQFSKCIEHYCFSQPSYISCKKDYDCPVNKFCEEDTCRQIYCKDVDDCPHNNKKNPLRDELNKFTIKCDKKNRMCTKVLDVGCYLQGNCANNKQDYKQRIKDDYGCQNKNACSDKYACMERAESIHTFCQNTLEQKFKSIFVDTTGVETVYSFPKVAAKYSKMEDGHLCSISWTPITTEADCIAAADELNLKWGTSWNGTADFPGCLHANDGRNLVYFNKSPSPSNTVNNPKYSAICKLDEGCSGADWCCTFDNLCDVGDGHCNNDHFCKPGLMCSLTNCPKKVGLPEESEYSWDQHDKCCGFNPGWGLAGWSTGRNRPHPMWHKGK